MTVESPVLARRQGRAGRITLNRPRALNALDLPMIDAVATALAQWRDDPEIHLVVIESRSDRAFCAGGDIRAIRDLVLAQDFDAVEAFFSREYALNLAIGRFPKPYVALIDGVCMGGGIGLSVHGGVRVASEHAQFAMPEVHLGFFPDVGGSFFLPRLRGEYGAFLGLTGTRIEGGDACWLGLATHFVPRASMAGLADALAENGIAALSSVVQPPPPPTLPPASEIGRIFGQQSVDAISASLAALNEDWARTALAAMRAGSPRALRQTLALLQGGRGQTLEEALQTELALTRSVVRHADFAEGVRAMVVDKDRTPRWSPE